MDKIIQIYGGFDGIWALTENGRLFFKKYGSRSGWLEEDSPIQGGSEEQGAIQAETPKQRKERLERETEDKVWGKNK